jgi:hypothetical protein
MRAPALAIALLAGTLLSLSATAQPSRPVTEVQLGELSMLIDTQGVDVTMSGDLGKSLGLGDKEIDTRQLIIDDSSTGLKRSFQRLPDDGYMLAAGPAEQEILVTFFVIDQNFNLVTAESYRDSKGWRPIPRAEAEVELAQQWAWWRKAADQLSADKGAR